MPTLATTFTYDKEDYQDRPHRLAVRTDIDGVGVRRRVRVQNRNTGSYIVSGVTDDNGFIEFTHMNGQSLRHPHMVVVFDDRDEGAVKALIEDRVYQVDDNGFPPEN